MIITKEMIGIVIITLMGVWIFFTLEKHRIVLAGVVFAAIVFVLKMKNKNVVMGEQ